MTFTDPYRGKTVGIAHLRREQIYATCTACGSAGWVDLEQLVNQGKGDFTLQRLVEALVCRKSRHPRPTIEVIELSKKIPLPPDLARLLSRPWLPT